MFQGSLPVKACDMRDYRGFLYFSLQCQHMPTAKSADAPPPMTSKALLSDHKSLRARFQLRPMRRRLIGFLSFLDSGQSRYVLALGL